MNLKNYSPHTKLLTTEEISHNSKQNAERITRNIENGT